MEIKKLSETIKGNGTAILYGPSGSGKTMSLATLPQDETLIISTERGLLTLMDIAPNLGVLEVSTMNEMREAFGIAAKSNYKYIAIDSLTKLADICLVEEMEKTKDGRRAYVELSNMMTKIIDSCLALDKTIILTAQEERVHQEDAGLLDYVFAPSVPGRKYANKLAYFFDFVFALRSRVDEDGKTERRFQTGLHGDYLAKSRTQKLELFEDANWTHIFAKIKG